MVTLILFIALAIVVSFYCSLLESAFLSITPAYVQLSQADPGSKGQTLARLKQEVDRPLAAILSLNTIAHTLGAAGAGAQAAIVFGNEWVGLFSALLTLAILMFSEVIPKTLGAIHWRRLTGFVARTLPILIIVTYPLVWLSVRVSGLLQHAKPRQVMRGEIQALAEIGKEEGAISPEESSFIQSMLQFRDTKVDKVMTPVSVVQSVCESETAHQVLGKEIPFSRIPVYKNSPLDITGYVLKDDLHETERCGNGARLISQFKRGIFNISAQSDLPHAINYFSQNHSHIAAVVDQSGNALGVVTLEDTVETLLGWEIVDEFDPIPDMRELAKELDTNNDSPDTL